MKKPTKTADPVVEETPAVRSAAQVAKDAADGFAALEAKLSINPKVARSPGFAAMLAAYQSVKGEMFSTCKRLADREAGLEG